MTDHPEAASGETPAPQPLVDIVFPGDTNHHGTLFGGAALALMDRIAFIVATRHGRVPFVTASCDRIDFHAPARIGQIASFSGRPVRVGRRSMVVDVEMVAEDLATGGRDLCSRGQFTMVGMPQDKGADWHLPPLAEPAPVVPAADFVGMTDIVFPGQTNSAGALFGGDALARMTKAAFVAATRLTGKAMVLASCSSDFKRRVAAGTIVDTLARVTRTGRSSTTIEVELWSEELLSGVRVLTVTGTFVMVAVDSRNRPVAAFAA